MSSVPSRRCGRSELSLPVLGLGCWAFGGGSYWGAQDERAVDAVVRRALDLGMNFFDTAEGYNDGASEASLGRALGGRRSEAIIGTKLSPNHAYPGMLRRHCEASLRRLGTEWIDLYMLHWPLNPSALRHFTGDAARIADPPRIGDVLAEMETLRREGKIRHLGLSNFGPDQLAEALECGVAVAADELPYNLLMRAAEFTALPFCAARGIGVLGYSALLQGILAGRWTALDQLPAIRLRTRHFAGTRPGSRHREPGIEPETLAALSAISQIADEAGRSVSSLALAWAAANPAVTCTLVGCRNLEQLGDNVAALDQPLAPDLKRRLDERTAEVKAQLGASLDYFQSREESRNW